MQRIIGFIVLLMAAVAAATLLGRNEGLVSIFWGHVRYDVSLNLFALATTASVIALYVVVHSVGALVSLPARARQWRAARADQVAQSTLRQALAYYLGGRYTRAHKAAMRAVALSESGSALPNDHEFAALAHLLAAGSLHRLQDRTRCEEHLQQAIQGSARTKGARPVEEGARLMSAEWALEDRDANRALERLAALSPGVARRTQALRLKLQATQLAGASAEALRTARLLAKHQAFSTVASSGLVRTLAAAVLDGACDADQLRRTWHDLDPADRRDPIVAAHAAARLSGMGAVDEARQWLRPFCERLVEWDDEEREALCAALAIASHGLPADWLPLVETASARLPRDPIVAHVVGRAFFERQLWGKAQRHLDLVVISTTAPAALRRDAWVCLARIAEHEDNDTRAAECYRAAAVVR